MSVVVVNYSVIEKLIEDAPCRSINAQKWLKSTFRRWLINNMTIISYVDLTAELSGSLRKRLAMGAKLAKFEMSAEASIEIYHMFDFLNANHAGLPEQFALRGTYSGISVEQMLARVVKWDRWMEKNAAKAKTRKPEKPGDSEVITDWGSYRLVEIKTKNGLSREGNIMGHCIGSYWEHVKDGKYRVFSIRDNENIPHVTFHTPSDMSTIFEAKGRGNKNVNSRYLPLLKEAILTLGIKRSGAISHSGFVICGNEIYDMALHDAIRANNVEQVEILLNAGYAPVVSHLDISMFANIEDINILSHLLASDPHVFDDHIPVHAQWDVVKAVVKHADNIGEFEKFAKAHSIPMRIVSNIISTAAIDIHGTAKTATRRRAMDILHFMIPKFMEILYYQGVEVYDRISKIFPFVDAMKITKENLYHFILFLSDDVFRFLLRTREITSEDVLKVIDVITVDDGEYYAAVGGIILAVNELGIWSVLNTPQLIKMYAMLKHDADEKRRSGTEILETILNRDDVDEYSEKLVECVVRRSVVSHLHLIVPRFLSDLKNLFGDNLLNILTHRSTYGESRINKNNALNNTEIVVGPNMTKAILDVLNITKEDVIEFLERFRSIDLKKVYFSASNLVMLAEKFDIDISNNFKLSLYVEARRSNAIGKVLDNPNSDINKGDAKTYKGLNTSGTNMFRSLMASRDFDLTRRLIEAGVFKGMGGLGDLVEMCKYLYAGLIMGDHFDLIVDILKESKLHYGVDSMTKRKRTLMMMSIYSALDIMKSSMHNVPEGMDVETMVLDRAVIPLLKAGSNPNFVSPGTHASVWYDLHANIHLPIMHGFPKILETMIKYGGDINVRDALGATALPKFLVNLKIYRPEGDHVRSDDFVRVAHILNENGVIVDNATLGSRYEQKDINKLLSLKSGWKKEVVDVLVA